MDIYVVVQRWTKQYVSILADRVTGVILGDLFCQKRMFDHDWFSIIDIARHARREGLNIVFQSPMYNTTRTMETTVSLVQSLHTSNLVDAVLVHDIGVLQSLNRFEGLSMWWDRHAFNRDFVPSAYLINFLMSQGVSRVEVVRPGDIQPISSQGCEVMLYAHGPSMVSFGRICYTEYFLNEPCERKILCENHSPFIASVDKVHSQYIADGYMLLDKKEPQHTVPVLTPNQTAKIAGMFVHIRRDEELSALEEIREVFREKSSTAAER